VWAALAHCGQGACKEADNTPWHQRRRLPAPGCCAAQHRPSTARQPGERSPRRRWLGTLPAYRAACTCSSLVHVDTKHCSRRLVVAMHLQNCGSRGCDGARGVTCRAAAAPTLRSPPRSPDRPVKAWVNALSVPSTRQLPGLQGPSMQRPIINPMQLGGGGQRCTHGRLRPAHPSQTDKSNQSTPAPTPATPCTPACAAQLSGQLATVIRAEQARVPPLLLAIEGGRARRLTTPWGLPVKHKPLHS
jgi:hypothetical protein